MKAYTFSNESGEITKRYSKKQAWLHVPSNEPRFKTNPYIEIYLESTPTKHTVTAIKVPFAELRRVLRRAPKKS